MEWTAIIFFIEFLSYQFVLDAGEGADMVPKLKEWWRQSN